MCFLYFAENEHVYETGRLLVCGGIQTATRAQSDSTDMLTLLQLGERYARPAQHGGVEIPVPHPATAARHGICRCGAAIRFSAGHQRAAADRPISSPDRRNIFLTVKEALHNVAKHARVTEIQLSMAATDALRIRL